MKEYIKKNYLTLFKILLNILLFIPYYFSINYTLKTLFKPWKNIVEKKDYRGFSFSKWLSIKSFNLFSRIIGLTMRLFLITLYLVILSLYSILLAVIVIISLLLLPFLTISYYLTDKNRLQKLKEDFINGHSTTEKGREEAEEWFENYYYPYINNSWWKKENLFSIKPLGNDWAIGYTPTLDKYSIELTSKEYQNKIKNVLDREKEITEIEIILSQNENHNVILVGEEGVGKHSIVDRLSKRIFEGKSGYKLAHKRILKLRMDAILSKYEDLTQKKEFISMLFHEAEEVQNIILFIENLEEYVQENNPKSNLSTVISEYAKKNSLQFIATTTPFLYQKYIIPAEKINRVFQKVKVDEIKKEEAKKILLNVAIELENRHGLKISIEAINDAIEKSDYFITEIPFPEKAIEILDYACILAKKNKNLQIVLSSHIEKAIQEKTHKFIKLDNLLKSNLDSLYQALTTSLKGQNNQLKKISSTIKASFLELGRKKKPIASLLLLGPTGVGKTETAKIISKTLFPKRKLLRFDMSNFQTKEDIKKLIGDIITNTPGLLSSMIEKQPSGVLLLDEIEKANKGLINIFLSILDEGYFTDGFGKKIDCKNLIIIATSNAGAEIIRNNKIAQYEFIDNLVKRGVFSREFLNRFDNIIIYNTLDFSILKEIALQEIKKLKKEFKIYKNECFTEEEIEKVINSAESFKFGARYLKKEIRKRFEENCV